MGSYLRVVYSFNGQPYRCWLQQWNDDGTFNVTFFLEFAYCLHFSKKFFSFTTVDNSNVKPPVAFYKLQQMLLVCRTVAKLRIRWLKTRTTHYKSQPNSYLTKGASFFYFFPCQLLSAWCGTLRRNHSKKKRERPYSLQTNPHLWNSDNNSKSPQNKRKRFFQ